MSRSRMALFLTLYRSAMSGKPCARPRWCDRAGDTSYRSSGRSIRGDVECLRSLTCPKRRDVSAPTGRTKRCPSVARDEQGVLVGVDRDVGGTRRGLRPPVDDLVDRSVRRRAVRAAHRDLGAGPPPGWRRTAPSRTSWRAAAARHGVVPPPWFAPGDRPSATCVSLGAWT